MKKILISSVFLFACVLFCFAADLTGNWKGTVKTQNGDDLELTYKLKADGEKLTGTVGSSYGDLPLIDGKIKGDTFSFKLDFGGNVMEQTGKLYTDSIVVGIKMQGNEIKNTFKRVVAN